MEGSGLTTEQTYQKVLEAEGITQEIERLDGSSLLWIGSSKAKSVIVCLCGGALVLQAYKAHIQWQVNAYKGFKAKGQNVSIAIFSYGLSPTSPYPNQVRQTVAAAEHLLQSRPAESITLTGDSAGAALILALLLHTQHSHPSVPPFSLPPSHRFNEAFLISPGVTFPSSTPSMRQSSPKDVFTIEAMKSIWNSVVGAAEKGAELPNPWIVGSTAPEEWWKGLPVGKVTIIVGGYELMKDDILILANTFKKYHDKEVEIHCFENEFHNQALIDFMTGAEDKYSAKLWKQWFQDFKA